jgi:integrase
MKRKPYSRGKRNTTKSVLRLPDLEHAKAAVLNSLTSLDAQRGYRYAIDEFVDWYCSEPRLALNRIVVLRYRSHLESRQLAPGTVNLRLGAARRLAYEAADCGLLSADLAAGIRRVKGVKKLGVRLGNWLTAEQGQALWQAPDHQRLKGKRDRALLALLLACGLRRHEAVALTFDHLQQREEHWAIVDLIGKGGHVRTVPVPDWVKTEPDDWLAAAASDRGKLFRRVNKVGRTWGDGMTVKGCLAHCEGIRQAHRHGEIGAARSATYLCSALPCFGRRVGADPIPFGTCLSANDRTISRLQAADSISRQ